MANTFNTTATTCPWRRTYWKDSMYGYTCLVLENVDIQNRADKECVEQNCAIQHFINQCTEAE